MTAETLFSLSGNLAMIGWAALALSPRRWGWLLATTGLVIPGVLSLLYGALMLTHFSSVEGGGYGSLGEVSALLSNDYTLLAGWVHYLAFDLAVGTWIAQRADRAGISRVIQLPLLFMTLMFGPLGFVIFVMLERGWMVFRPATKGAAP